MFPKHDHFSIEQLVKWNAPGALCSPERGAKANQPRTVVSAVLRAVLHLQACIAGPAWRQRGESFRRLNENDAGTLSTLKAFRVKFIADGWDFHESSSVSPRRPEFGVRPGPRVSFLAGPYPAQNIKEALTPQGMVW